MFVNRTVLWPVLPVAAKRRPLLERWLDANADKRIRFLLAPAGWGKTGTLLRYASKSPNDAAYCKVPADCMPDEFLDRLALGLNIAFCNNEHEMVKALDGIADSTEIILDDLDRAHATTIALFLRVARKVRPVVRFIAGVRCADLFSGCGPDCAFS